MSWIFIADDGGQVHYEVPPQVVVLRQRIAELEQANETWRTDFAKLKADNAKLREAEIEPLNRDPQYISILEHGREADALRIAELEARELGYIQSLRTLEAENQRLRELVQFAHDKSDVRINSEWEEMMEAEYTWGGE